MSRETLNTPKISKEARLNRRQRRQKRKQNIKKIFNQLREVSENPSDVSLIDSAIKLDSSIPNTVISLGNAQNGVGPSQNVQEASIILIDDDVQRNECSTPQKQFSLHHSTPISKKNRSRSDLILSPSNNNTNLQNLNENNVTKEINADSYLTIDLTTDTGFNKSQPTVIDLVNDCTLASASNVSMSGDSDVSVIPNQPASRKLKKFTKGIANLNASEKGKLLEMITQTLFNGCSIPANIQSSLTNIQRSLPRAPETAEDTYIKEVIVGGKASRHSIGSNVYHPDRKAGIRTGLRMIVVDGSNVAMTHGRGQFFSVRGLQICIDYFLRRGHVVKAFVPRFRCKLGMSTDGKLLDFLERKGLVIYTPSRQIKGRTVTPYDDRYIIQCAAEFEGVIVSGDNYQDLISENPKWKFVIENRILPFTWVEDMIMFPRDPLGRHGPTLKQFLRHSNGNPV